MTDTVELLAPAIVEQLSTAQLAEYVTLLESYKAEQAKRWDLTEKQILADKLADEVDELLYGGAAGGGKTEWALHRAYRLCQQHAGVRVLYLRKSFPELWRTAISRSLVRFDSSVCTYYVGRKEWRFKNDSYLEFGYLESPEDVYQYDSAEYMCIIFDELTQFTKDQYDFLQGRLRVTATQEARGARTHTIAMSNPGGAGHKWVRDWFVTPTEYGQKIATLETIQGDPSSAVKVAFVPSFVSDNPHVSKDYIRRLKRLPEKLMRQRLFGDWDTFDGQYFSELNRDVHVVEPFTLPPDWPRFCGMDHGFAAPTAVVWCAVGPDGEIYVYKEYEQDRFTVQQHIEQIHAIDGDDRIDYRMIDPTTNRLTATGDNIFRQYLQGGLPVRMGANTRIDGWSHLRSHLQIDPETNKPGIYLFSTCAKTYDCLAGLVHSSSNPEDVRKADDHLADALRYALMSRPRRNIAPNNDGFTSDMDPELRMLIKRQEAQGQWQYHDMLGRI